MSGGHWNYKSYTLQEQGEYVKAVFDLLAEIEHELDWGICGDTCLACAERRLPPVLKKFFDGEYSEAVELMGARDYKMCDRCKEWK